MSFVARVIPFRVLSVPVLCATAVPDGSSALIRFSPIVVSVSQPVSSTRLGADTARPDCSARNSFTAATGVLQFLYCTIWSAAIARSLAAIVMPSMPSLRTIPVTSSGGAQINSMSDAVPSLSTIAERNNSRVLRRVPFGLMSRIGL